MTHKQKGLISYGLALLTLAASLLFWTKMAGAISPLKDISRWDLALLAWDQGRALLDDKEPSENMIGTVESETFHLDGLVAYTENVETSESAGVPPPVDRDIESPATVPEEVVGGEDDELKQWELRQAYGISIPAIGLRAPVLLPSLGYWSAREWDLLEEQMQVGLNNGAVAYPHSVMPGAKGSLFIAGHSSPPNERAQQSAYGHLFARLPELKAGDTVSVSFAGSRVTYEVTGSRIVPAFTTSLLQQQSDGSQLTLITCYPIGTTRDRMVVTAVLVE